MRNRIKAAWAALRCGNEAKTEAAQALLKSGAWALVIVERENTRSMCDLTATESIDALSAMMAMSDTLVSMREEQAAGPQGEVNVNEALQIANGNRH